MAFWKIRKVKPLEIRTDEEYFEFIDNLFNNDDMQIENIYDYEEDENGNPTENKKETIDIAIDIKKIKSKKFNEVKNLTFYDIKEFTRMDDSEEGYFSYSSELNHFAYRFQIINGYYPTIYRFEEFNVYRFLNDLFKHFKIPESCYNKISFQGTDESKLTSFLIAFKKDLVLYFDGPDDGVIYYNQDYENDKDSMLYDILALLRGVRKPKVSKNKIYIVYRNQHGFDKIGFDVKKINVDLQENYNDGFVEKSLEIVEGLNNKDKTNLVILSGDAGVGKCVSADTKITVRNKKTGKIEVINIADLM
jgi:hypothetical protein